MGKRESLGCRILRHIRPSKRPSHVRILAMTSTRNAKSTLDARWAKIFEREVQSKVSCLRVRVLPSRCAVLASQYF
jgi:hypothetical protein